MSEDTFRNIKHCINPKRCSDGVCNVILIHIHFIITYIFLEPFRKSFATKQDGYVKVTVVHTLLDFLFNHMQYYSNHDPSAVLFPPYL